MALHNKASAEEWESNSLSGIGYIFREYILFNISMYLYLGRADGNLVGIEWNQRASFICFPTVTAVLARTSKFESYS